MPIMIFLYLILTLLLLGLTFYLVYTTYSPQAGAVYYPTKPETVREMLLMANAGPDDVVIDLGSGDGRFLIAAAKLGARAIGYETDPVLVWESRRNIKKAGLEHLCSVRLKSLYKADFNEGTIITLYLFPKFMDRLQTIMEKKLTHPLRLISNDYQFPRKKFTKQQGKLFLYDFQPLRDA